MLQAILPAGACLGGASELWKLHFQSRLANTLIGDWVITTMYQYQTGGLVTFLNGSTASPGDYVYLGAPLNLNNRQVNGTAFNYHLRTDGINQLDANIVKCFSLGEHRRFELRFEAYNLQPRIRRPTPAASAPLPPPPTASAPCS